MNPSMVNFILEHGNEKDKICSICHDDENSISKDNILALNCCHVFHIECGVKSLIETDMSCPICRNKQDFSWGKSGVYIPVIEYVIDHKYYEFLSNFIDTDGNNNDQIMQHTILTENLDMLKHLHSLNGFHNKLKYINIILENRKYKALEWYAKISVHQDEINNLLCYAITNSDMFAIMYLIYEFKADIYSEIDGLSMLCYAVRTNSFEIVSYLIHDLCIDVHTYDNIAIKTALSDSSDEIVRLCLENMSNPSHPNNADMKSELEDDVEHVRELIIQNAIKKLDSVTFSKIISKTCIHPMIALQLFEFFRKQIMDREIIPENIDILRNVGFLHITPDRTIGVISSPEIWPNN